MHIITGKPGKRMVFVSVCVCGRTHNCRMTVKRQDRVHVGNQSQVMERGCRGMCVLQYVSNLKEAVKRGSRVCMCGVSYSDRLQGCTCVHAKGDK